MNYIYDIILNFNDNLIDFYDWNNNDNIVDVKRIPIVCVNSKTYCDLITSSFKLDDNFINKIKNKCEIYMGRKSNRVTAFLLTDMNNITAFKITNKIEYSSLQVNDELDILEDLFIKPIYLKYKVKKKNKVELKTRNQLKNELYIKEELDKMFIENNYEKLKYIYYECFNKKENRIDYIKKDLFNIETNSDTMRRLYNVLTSINS